MKLLAIEPNPLRGRIAKMFNVCADFRNRRGIATMAHHDRFCVLTHGTRSGDERLSYKAHISRPSPTSKETTEGIDQTSTPIDRISASPLLNEEAYSQLVIEEDIFVFELFNLANPEGESSHPTRVPSDRSSNNPPRPNKSRSAPYSMMGIAEALAGLSL